MRPTSFAVLGSRPDPLSAALRAHAQAEDQVREARRISAALRGMLRGALAAATGHRSRGDEALRRGDELAGLSHHDAALEAGRTARRAGERLAEAGRRERNLASVERARRTDLFKAIQRFVEEADREEQVGRRREAR